MTIESFDSRWDYVGDDDSTSFDWDNLVEKETDLRVFLDGVLQTIVVDYTVTGAGTKLGSVDFLVAPANGVAVAMVRKTDRDQLTAYPTNGPFPAASHVGTVDKLTIIDQEDLRDRRKLIGFNEFSLVEDIFIDDPVADALLAFSPDGLSIINGPSATAIANDVIAAAASAAAAAVSEANAAISAAAALASEGNASASEIAAAASAAAAAVSEAAAAASAAAAAISAARLAGTSVTAVALGVGAKVFETQAGKLFDAGTFLLVYSDADPSKFMAGQVASYVGTTLTLNVTQFEGAGSPADWTIQVSGKFGVDGAQAPRTVIIVTDDLDISDGFVHNTFYQIRPVAEALVTITIPDATTAGFIDGYEGTFHLDLPGSILINTPSTPPVTEIDGSADLVIGDPGKAVTLVASTTTADWQISQDNRIDEGVGVTLFATTSADPIIAGYAVAVTDNDDVRYDDPAVTVTTPTITNAALDRGTAELISTFIADAGAITDLLDNDLVITVVVNKTPAPAKTARFFSQFIIRASGGGETVIKETATSGLVEDTPGEQTLIFSNVTVDILATDRVVVKTWGFKESSGGTNPAIQFPVGGKLPADTPARLKIPQSLSSVAHNSTSGLQGGTPGEFFHMTELQNDTFPGIKGVDIASADPLVIGVDGSMFDVTGNVDFADMTVAANRDFTLRFTGTPLITNSATIIISGGDFQAVAGDVWECQSIAADTVLVTNITKADGTAVVGGGAEDYIFIRDEKSSGTQGGTFTSGAWRTRDLNVEVSDAGSHASIASNQITLAAGTYRFQAFAPGYAVNSHKLRLQNITDVTTIIMGNNTDSAAGTAALAQINGRFTIAASKVLELQHRCTATVATNGLGNADSFGTEIYASIEFWKEG